MHHVSWSINDPGQYPDKRQNTLIVNTNLSTSTIVSVIAVWRPYLPDWLAFCSLMLSPYKLFVKSLLLWAARPKTQLIVFILPLFDKAHLHTASDMQSVLTYVSLYSCNIYKYVELSYTKEIPLSNSPLRQVILSANLLWGQQWLTFMYGYSPQLSINTLFIN